MATTLIVYYSRTGNTKKIATALVSMMHADDLEVFDKKTRTGIFGWLTAGRDATFKKVGVIDAPKLDFSPYELVVICTPVWAFTMATPIRTWLIYNSKELLTKKVAFVATMGGSGDKRAFFHMTQIIKKSPVCTATFLEKEIHQNAYEQKLSEFLLKI